MEVLHCRQFVNADEIARGLSPSDVESVQFQAGRIMLERVYQLLGEGVDFALETTLATRSYEKLVCKAQAMGYTVSLLFFWLPSADMAIQRVAQRVAEGGHDIPETTIRRRYGAGLRNFFQRYSGAVDFWTFSDCTNFVPAAIAAGNSNGVQSLYQPDLWNNLLQYYGHG